MRHDESTKQRYPPVPRECQHIIELCLSVLTCREKKNVSLAKRTSPTYNRVYVASSPYFSYLFLFDWPPSVLLPDNKQLASQPIPTQERGGISVDGMQDRTAQGREADKREGRQDVM